MPLAQSTISYEFNNRLKTEPIAIIGMASIFPKAKNIEEYWQNILEKIDCITDVPADRWSVDDYYDPDPTAEDKTYCKRGGFIPDIEFDPTEFGLPPNILEVTDVSQLLGLVVAKEALEDAGYGEGVDFPKEYTGVILGVVGMATKLFTPLMSRLQYPVWEKVLRNSGVPEEIVQKVVQKIKQNYVSWEENSFPGTIGNVIAGRIANRFDLGGTNCVVDAACASSLAAVKMAIAELIEGRAYMMLTGGVDTDNSINTYMCFSKTPAFTKGENVKAFDQDSSGMMVGEGLGMLVLKRLSDAEKDQDRIYAVIKAIGSSSDGRFKSIYAPRPEGQAKAIRRAYIEAGFSPQTVGLIEAHGTGTMAGDPAEFQGLNQVFGENNAQKQYIALGSVKSQIAHTKSTAGAASLIKVALALHHKVLPATINVTKPNPKLKIEDSPFYLNTETRPWLQPSGGVPRRAGVSSFGFGGTNFHVVLEEYSRDHSAPYRIHAVGHPIILHARNQEELLTLCQNELREGEVEPSFSWFYKLVDQSSDSEIPISHSRIGILARNPGELILLFKEAISVLKDKVDAEEWESPKGIYYRKSGIDANLKIVALFPGQGSQYLDMGKEILINFPEMRAIFSLLDTRCEVESQSSISTVVYPIPVFDSVDKDKQVSQLQKTEFAQPAIGALSMGLFKLFQNAGLQIDFCAGHSFGELTALWAAGVISDNDFLDLALARGRAMKTPDDPDYDAGGMLAVKTSGETIKNELGDRSDIILANWNSDQQVVVAGAKSAISAFQQELTGKGYSVVPLPVSAAFHTNLVGHAYKPFKQAINKKIFNSPSIRVYSNSTGKEYPSQPDQIKKILANHILQPVLFCDEIRSIYDDGGRIFIEFGPKGVLTGLVSNILRDKPHHVIAINGNHKKDSDIQLREAYIRMKVLGIKVGVLDRYANRRRFDQKRKKAGMTFLLSGGLYLSEKTRQRQIDALRFENLWDAQGNNKADILSPEKHNLVDNVEKYSPLVVCEKPMSEEADMVVKKPRIFLQDTEKLLDVFQSNQKELARIHSQYLANEAEYSRIFSQLTQMELTLMTKDGDKSKMDLLGKLFESIGNSLDRFHEHQSETMKVHEMFLKQQQEVLSGLIDLVSTGSPIEKQSTKFLDNEIRIEKQPVPLVPKDIDFSLVASQPSTPAPLIAGEKKNGSRQLTIDRSDQNEVLPPQVEDKVEDNGKQPFASDHAISEILLSVVSEKTGYPREMLDLDMDMEADLGIDSIKRVEILGAIQDHFPDLPKPDPESLAEMRTLRQIIEKMEHKALPLIDSKLAESGISSNVNVDQKAPENVNFDLAAKNAVDSTSGILMDQLIISLLNVVSEKTGYPQEMLDLDMDMEADLGIDSIKRVEILGSMQDQYPDLPKPDPEALSEMRTLRQIVNTLGALNSIPEKDEIGKKNKSHRTT